MRASSSELRELCRKIQHLVLLADRPDRGESVGDVGQDTEHRVHFAVAELGQSLGDDRAHGAVAAHDPQVELEAGAIRRCMTQLALDLSAVVRVRAGQREIEAGGVTLGLKPHQIPHLRRPDHRIGGGVPMPVPHVADAFRHRQKACLVDLGCCEVASATAGACRKCGDDPQR